MQEKSSFEENRAEQKNSFGFFVPVILSAVYFIVLFALFCVMWGYGKVGAACLFFLLGGVNIALLYMACMQLYGDVRLKDNKKARSMLAIVLCVVMFGCTVTGYAVFSRDGQYARAQLYIEQCRYEEALNILQELGGYKDADYLFDYAIYMQNGQYGAWVKKNNLTEFSIPKSATFIANDVFSLCDNLVKVNIPDSVISIGAWTFYECISLTEIVIPDSVTSIGSYAFYGCSALRNIRFNGTMQQWKKVTKGTGWNYNVPVVKVICTDGAVSIE